MLTIGHFAEVTHLSRKTLRHYHEAGPLEPQQVDPDTGYRYYSSAQIPTAQVIRRFREMGMPVAEVRSVLLASAEDRGALIASHLSRLEEQLATIQAAVTALRRLLAPEPHGLVAAAGRVRPIDIPPAELAVTVHSGPHDDIDVTYGELGA